MDAIKNSAALTIERGATALGIELGSTRIKAVLVDEECNPLAQGVFEWENSFEGGYWTYDLADARRGLALCYEQLKLDVQRRYGVQLRRLGALGISAMMHGYLAFDDEGNLLVPFRTWRNTTAAQAAAQLSSLFGFHIPERWSVAHLYQAVLDNEPHVGHVAHMTTLAGYVHELLCGNKVLSVGDASGMFPIDAQTRDYDETMVGRFEAIEAVRGLGLRVCDILPQVLCAGEEAGRLTEEGALLLDPTGDLEAGCPLCPPEGDAGTGMIATNAVAPRTGNVSAGTSGFSMTVLEGPLKDPTSKLIDLVTTPAGDPVAMVHCNNCTSDINAWVGLFQSYNRLMGFEVSTDELFSHLFGGALGAEPDAGGLTSVPFVSAEPVASVESGHPLMVREPTGALDVQSLMRANIMSAFAVLRTGQDCLAAQGVTVDEFCAHGGIFKTPVVAQRLLAAVLDVPVKVMETAGEGGAWGQAVAAAYMLRRTEGQSLATFLDEVVFVRSRGTTLVPDEGDVAGFQAYSRRFERALVAVRALGA